MVHSELVKRHASKSEDPFFNMFVLYITTGDAITNAAELELAQYGVNFPQARILFMLNRENRPVTIQELSQWVLRELNSVSILINKMETAGLVQKTRIPGDKKTYISLTDGGSELFNRITSKAPDMIFSALTDSERKELETYLKKLLKKARNLLGMDFKPPFLLE
jgi:DNA-binding MarR family transcriptional regulator